MKPTLIVVSGLPATGKSTLARRLSSDLHLPLVSKDDYKEILYDVFGYLDRELWKKFGPASFEMMWHTTRILLGVGFSLLIETHFPPRVSTPNLLRVIEPFAPRVIQVYCHAPFEKIFARDQARLASGEHHPGHHGIENMNLEQALSYAQMAPLEIGGEVISLDTSDFDKLDYPGLLGRIQGFLTVA